MPLVYVGVGSNEGERERHLQSAYKKLHEKGVPVVRKAPVFETPAHLPEGAPVAWDKPYLNTAWELETSLSPLHLLKLLQSVEQECGRKRHDKWAPRTLDLDLLLYGEQNIQTSELTVPHPNLTERAFALDPLSHLCPQITVPGTSCTVVQWARKHPKHQPLLMGIVNVTPDSFSDGGEAWELERAKERLATVAKDGAHIIDLGAESTRPGATLLSQQEEWQRLQPVLEMALEKRSLLGPWVSVDTRHPKTAAAALECGVDIINDVSGLSNPAMQELAFTSKKDFVAMHQLGLPADKNHTFTENEAPLNALKTWRQEQQIQWQKKGLYPERVIIDPGIGFGKTGTQSLEILQRLEEVMDSGFRFMVGHSRKSFMSRMTTSDFHERDMETVGASLKLISKGVDILRVHNVAAHRKAINGWLYAQA